MMDKVRNFLSQKANRVALSVGGSFGAVAGGLAAAFAADPTTSDIVGGVTTVTSAVTSNFNIATIAEIIGVVLGACVGLFLFWWGARKVVRMVSAAFKKGKISL